MKKFTQHVLTLAATTTIAGSAHAAALTWDGGGTNNLYTNAQNWNPDVAPSTSPTTSAGSDDLTFGTTTKPTISIPSGQQANTLTFNAPNSYDLQVDNNQQFILRGAAVTVTAGNHTIGGTGNARLQVSTNTTISVASGSSLTFNNFGPNGKNILYTGGGTITETGSLFAHGAFTIDSPTTFILGGNIGNGTSSGSGQLFGNGTITGDNSATIWRMQFGQSSTNADFSGTISNNIEFIKGRSNNSDPKVQALSGNNSYVGTTTVRTGYLLVNGTHTGGDSYTVVGQSSNNNGAGFLGGSGTISLATTGGPRTINIGDGVLSATAGRGVLAPGATVDSVGTLTMAASTLNFDGTDGTYEVSLQSNPLPLGDTADRVNLVGDVSVGSGAILDLVGLAGFNPTDFFDGKTYSLLTYSGSLTGAFTLDSADTTLLSSNNYQLSYLPGNVVLAPVVTGVPEPVSVSLLGLGGLLLLRRRRAV